MICVYKIGCDWLIDVYTALCKSYDGYNCAEISDVWVKHDFLGIVRSSHWLNICRIWGRLVLRLWCPSSHSDLHYLPACQYYLGGELFIDSFIPYISYSASSSLLLLGGAPDYSINAVSELTRRSITGSYKWRTCPRSLRGGWSGIRMCDPLDTRLRSYHWATMPPWHIWSLRTTEEH